MGTRQADPEKEKSAGRISPLNMAETSGLSYEVLIQDMTAAVDSTDDSSLCIGWA